MNKTKTASLMLSSLSIYRGILTRSVPKAMYKLLLAIDKEPNEFLEAYGEFYSLLCDRGCSENLCYNFTEAALFDENYFTRTATAGKVDEMSENEKQATIRDIEAILFASSVTPTDILADYKYINENPEVFYALPKWNCGEPAKEFQSFNGSLDEIAKFHRVNGCGMFARYRSFVWREGGIQPIINADKVKISDLVDYEYQRNLVVENTKSFIEGKNANNCLLYGDMGTGKSTTVKAVVNEYRHMGLRVVEMPKERLMDFPLLVDTIASVPMKFIIFIDDLSFQRQDECYTSLKAVLEGGVTALPKNALIYATSNRRHLVKENFEDRDCSEVNRRDNMQETLSLSDRFGLAIGYYVPDKKKYLHIVEELAKSHNIDIPVEELRLQAEAFATQRATRSPRTAQQFIKSLL
jgi:hypothetical protein